MRRTDTIVAPATGQGGAIAVIRVSGEAAFEVTDKVFRSSRGRVADAEGYTILYGRVMDGANVLDDVLVSVFRAPRSYTGENAVEISCHASGYIVGRMVALLIDAGARAAPAGEFTQRAFVNGKMDLSQAEAVADMIASASAADHRIAMNQMRGGFSRDLAELRAELLNITSLLELELDFSEEDVEFADRSVMRSLLKKIQNRISTLAESFRLGNAIKNGVAVAIVGAPNVGKSTLLNRLLNDDRAMVSDVAGTTRDVIEESCTIDGVRFRFMDTAGIRATDDRLEQMGIDRTHGAIERADVVLHLSVAGDECEPLECDAPVIRVFNKADRCGVESGRTGDRTVVISAKQGTGVDALRAVLREVVDTSGLECGATVVSNMRHYSSLSAALSGVEACLNGLDMNVPSDMLSEDVREVLFHLGEITGEITTDETLGNIFANFCIGK